MDEDVERFATKVPLPPLVTKRTQMLLQEWAIHTRPNDLSSNLLWMVCASYTALIEHRTEMESPSEPTDTISLLHLLKTADVNITEFFKCMKHIGQTYGHGTAVATSLKAIMQKYCVTVALYRTFDRLFDQIFESSAEVLTTTPSQEDRKKVTWCLYLLAKAKFMPRSGELHLPLQLLFCCLDYIIKQSPPFLVKEPFCSARYSDGANEPDGREVLQAVNEVCSCGVPVEIDDLLTIRSSLFQQFINGLPQDVLNHTADGLPKLNYLEKKYSAIFQKERDLDEVRFLTGETVLFPAAAGNNSGPASPDTTVTSGSTNVPSTPVRSALRKLQSLQTLLANAKDTPSPKLQEYFKCCSSNVSSDIQNRVERMRGVFVDKYVEAMGENHRVIALTRFRLGVRLYYRLMENLLNKEQSRLKKKDFINSLLSRDIFHQCLLACSLEVVMDTYGFTASPIPGVGGGSLDFPWILNVFDLLPYDFCKVIESFIRDEPHLSEQAMKHLHQIEGHILECLAWKDSSPLFEILRARLSSGASLTSLSPPSIQQLATTSTAQLYLSPLRTGQDSPLSTGEATPPHGVQQSPLLISSSGDASSLNGTSQDPSSTSQDVKFRSVSLHIFLNKVLQLGYKRLQTMCAPFGITGELERYIWSCLEFCITKKPLLLKGRHLDQMVMCCMFAVCKANDRDIKFKDIVSVYKKLPHARPETYKSVKMEESRIESIITFYNQIFIPVLKDHILKFQPQRPTPVVSPVPSRSTNTPTRNATYRLHKNSNLYISPMKDSPFKSPRPIQHIGSPAQMTPTTSRLYCFGEENSSDKLREINELVQGFKRGKDRSVPSKSKKRLKLDVDQADDSSGTDQESSRSDDATTHTETQPANGHQPYDSNCNLQELGTSSASSLIRSSLLNIDSAQIQIERQEQSDSQEDPR